MRESGTRAYGYEMETPHATGPVAPGLEDAVARLIARASGTVEPAGAAHEVMAACHSSSSHQFDRPATPAVLLLRLVDAGGAPHAAGDIESAE